jgi:hypothetical protein
VEQIRQSQNGTAKRLQEAVSAKFTFSDANGSTGKFERPASQGQDKCFVAITQRGLTTRADSRFLPTLSVKSKRSSHRSSSM